MMAVPLVFNPAARSARASGLARRLSALEPQPELLETERAGDAKLMAKRLALAGEPVVAVAGGDGTINEVVAGLYEGWKESGHMPDLGVLPVGTMNVFALEMGLPVRDLKRCWAIIGEGRSREVDLWLANEHVFIQLAGIGLDAAVIEETSWDMKRNLGPFSYLLNAARLLARPAPLLRVRLEGGETIEGALVLFGNGKRYGGAMKMFPMASNLDGELDLVVLQDQSMVRILRFLTSLIAGKKPSPKNVLFARATSLSVESESPVPLEVDGEWVGETPVEIAGAETKLSVRIAGE